MSKLRRTLIVGVTLAAMSLTTMTARRPAQRRGHTTQREVSENWNHYNQATRIPPAELQARMQADAALQELSDRWTRYYQATRMSPAGLKAWTQGKNGADAPTAPPAQMPALTRPANRAGSRAGSSCPLGSWRRRWRWWLGWPSWPPGVRSAPPGSGRRPDHGHPQSTGLLLGAAAPSHGRRGRRRP